MCRSDDLHSLSLSLSLALSSLYPSALVTSGRTVTHLVVRERRENDRGPPREADARLSSSSSVTEWRVIECFLCSPSRAFRHSLSKRISDQLAEELISSRCFLELFEGDRSFPLVGRTS